MALYVDLSGYPTIVEMNLFEIVGSDLGLGDATVPNDNTVLQTTYVPSLNGFGQQLIDSLVNVFANTVVITGVDSTFVVGNMPITNIAGWAYVDMNGIIHVIYDTSRCGGSGYFVFDINGNKISYPDFISLAHELSHAFHACSGDSSSSAPEFQAISDENQVRSQNGMVLRDPSNSGGGCGFATSGGGNGCLIVTAALDSPLAPEINRFRRLRDVYLRGSKIGCEFFSQFFSEYYKFSPQVAKEVSRSKSLKTTVLKVIIEPLLCFFALMEAYIGAGWKQEAFPDQVEQAIERHRIQLTNDGFSLNDAQAVLEVVTRLKMNLSGAHEFKASSPESAFGPPKLLGPSSILEYIATAIETTSSGMEYVSWALGAPLVLYWSLLVDHWKGSHGGGCTSTHSFCEALNKWLGEVPIPDALGDLNEDDLGKDLAFLAGTVFTVPLVRERFAERIVKRYANNVSYDVRAVLQNAGYLHVAFPALKEV